MSEIGEILKSRREKLGFSQKEVSKQTRIQVHILQAMEQGDFSIISPVYAKAFFKTYSHFLKFSEQDLKEYISELEKQGVFQKTEKINITPSSSQNIDPKKFEHIFQKKKSGKFSNMQIINAIIYFTIGIGLIVILYLLFFPSTKPTPKATTGKGGDTAVIAGEKGLAKYYDDQDSIILEVKALDTTWLRITVDGKDNQPVYLQPKMERRWSAMKEFVIYSVNVGTVEFKRDGTVLPPFGRNGSTVRNVKVTRDNVITPSTVFSATQQPSTVSVSGSGQITEQPKRKAKKKQPQPQTITTPRILEPSNIQNYKPFEDKKKTEKPR